MCVVPHNANSSAVVTDILDLPDWTLLAKRIAQGSTPVENLIDSLLETYRVTLYKLKNLS